MKLLFDENLSYKLVNKLSEIFPGAKQVRDLNLKHKTDREIWNFARENGFAIVTFDADFYELSNYFGHPPKIIWLRIGNTHTKRLMEILAERASLIKEFLESEKHKEIACLEIT